MNNHKKGRRGLVHSSKDWEQKLIMVIRSLIHVTEIKTI